MSSMYSSSAPTMIIPEPIHLYPHPIPSSLELFGSKSWSRIYNYTHKYSTVHLKGKNVYDKLPKMYILLLNLGWQN